MSLASPAPAEPTPRRIPLRFTGSGAEYFRIWVVNLALTAMTLGVYSAWAKVRTRRYFYANLLVDGTGFEYTADPVRILIGRLILLALFVVYSLLGSFSEAAALLFFLLILVATPFLVVRSLAFHRRNTRHRGIRFKFLGSYGQAARVYLLWPVLAALSFGLAVPWAHGKKHEFLAGGTSYGSSRLSFSWKESDYYALYAKAIGVALGVAILAGIAGVVAGLGVEMGEAEETRETAFAAIVAAYAVAYLLAYALGYAVFQAGATNLLYGGTRLLGLDLQSTVPALGLLREYAICATAILLSFGLSIPWAQVRLARFRAEHLALIGSDGLDHFGQSAEEAHALGAFADEAAMAFDFDFGL